MDDVSYEYKCFRMHIIVRKKEQCACVVAAEGNLFGVGVEIISWNYNALLIGWFNWDV